jgi:hypothetical protein
VRRALTFVLLLLFSYPLVAPAFASAPDEASLPACCRRNGRHHCAMAGMGMEQNDRNTSVRERCPYCPQAKAIVWQSTIAAMTRQTLFAGMIFQPAAGAQAEAGFRISFSRSRQKRGPPQLLA